MENGASYSSFGIVKVSRKCEIEGIINNTTNNALYDTVTFLIISNLKILVF